MSKGNVPTVPMIFPAHVRVGAGTDDSETLLALAKSVAPDPTIFDEHDPFFWSAEISSNRLDSYFTRMAPSTLQNFADDANTGVAFLTGHDTRRLPLGRSMQGVFTRKNGEGNSRVDASFYTLKGMNTNGVSTDDFVMGVRSGVISDVSVGFHGGQFICNICGRDMMDWSDWDNMCMHIPGVEYELTNKKGEPTGKRQLCIADIENSRLSEVSGVYDGATPGASITKAIQLAEGGRLQPELAHRIESHYGNRFRIVPQPIWQGVTVENRSSAAKEESVVTTPIGAAREIDPAATEETPVDEVRQEEAPVETEAPETRENVAEVVELEGDDVRIVAEAPEVKAVEKPVVSSEPERAEVETPAEEIVTDVRASDEEHRETPGGEDEDMALADTLRTLVAESGISDLPEDPIEAVRAMNRELERLRPLADAGRTYRVDLIQDALSEGERAFGESFQREQREALLAKLDLEDIKAMRDDWRSVGDQTFQTGRVTKDEDEAEVEVTSVPGRSRDTKVKRELPATAYKS